MNNLLNPRWLIVINILPAIVLLIIFFNHYNIIESLLSPESKALWLDFFIALALLTGFQLTYLIFCVSRKANISVFYALINFIAYTTLLYCYVEHSSTFIPGSIPNWMITSDAVFYPGTFLMPTLAHALFILVLAANPKPSSTNAWLSFLYGISIPIIGYLFVQVILPLWRTPNGSFEMHSLIILGIAASTFFLFFICRGVYILSSLRSDWLLKYAIYWKAIIAILLPLLGLCFNNGIFFNGHGWGTSFFGNFKSPWFYIIATVNGIIICLPALKNPNLRLIRFLVLVTCFPYTIYFFLVFLPYLPLAVIAITVVGLGFLMLAPLLLFILQINELHREFQYLRQNFAPIKIAAGTIASLSILPLIITGTNLRDKTILNNALNYVYDPDYSKNYSVDRKSLLNTLTAIKKNKIRNHFLFSDNTPFITSYYNWLVLDNLILSDAKINTLNQIFFGEEIRQPRMIENTIPGSVKLSKMIRTSRFDKKQQCWISTLDLEITNHNTTGLASYETEFTLPEGCWISNYYLNIGNRKEEGILAEKKSAIWVFSQIKNEKRDPGLLYYLTSNRIAFKIFPFAAKEARKTGIELIHKEPVTLNFDGETVLLGTANPSIKPKIETINHAIYIPENEKSKLQLVKRKPVYHFIIDVSKGRARNIRSYMNRLTSFMSTNSIKTEDIRLDLTNSFSYEKPMGKDWKDMLSEHPFEGGFYLEGAVKKILVNSYKNNDGSFPIMIVLTDRLEHAITQNNFTDFNITFPENSNFYELDENHKLWIHSLKSDPKLRLSAITTLPNSFPVFAWPNAKKPIAYLANDRKPSIAIDVNAGNKGIPVNKKSWLSGLNLQGMWIRKNLFADPSGHSNLQLVRQSIQSGILSPSTSFIVVENKAQKMALLKKQDQILSGNKNLDTDEETQSMAEPDLYLLVALLLVIFIYKTKIKTFISQKTA